MLVLALDTATPTLVAGLARWSRDGDVQVLAERAVPSGNRHAELLTPAIQGVLDDAGLTTGHLDAVVTGLGPGPFTGLRVGVVTAAALADARGLPVVGVCSLDAIGSGSGRSSPTPAARRSTGPRTTPTTPGSRVLAWCAPRSWAAPGGSSATRRSPRGSVPTSSPTR
ncbi:tRNA (adenosine(37)-N6)-threonylcarbamoyltransferase complex dimerization subunit type 1 TsaB [Blastococcus brunescens]|uniref:tRNA (Adenosine(37)-N6)-threonylcarbamoyltransferase complex dimerization subunit type 1 TsaB n=1 Tax=Blastococcus brunescens TaxID=1564165 RepID=A0ABZ1AX59_9ACTN|nr:tRNA (adenosine(37)-N6)-threonylcarbamoyltransferase complex dimerization subunit type 1 TsaB [Blastococcus sp. BMG 8361]WRL63044.1 tRNA (adenosine(37)-N6)-threonylcarbamoyltransferase complex dimerization subunit type 1 TsaB [Blastococcus sp. BMG 8361]